MQLLAYRFSALGDVALTVPALRGVLQENPEIEITLVSTASLAPLFFGIERLNFYGVDLKNYVGITGLYRLFREISSLQEWTAVIDLHSVLRTWTLNNYFRIAGTPVFSIDKGRKEKAALVAKKNKVLKPLKHSAERYLDVFREAGFDCSLADGPVITAKPEATELLSNFLKSNGIEKTGRWIGLAPFSIHRQKTWPYAMVTALIEDLGREPGLKIFLLGGPAEQQELHALSSTFEHCHNMAGMFTLEEEIALMYELDAMIAMDSFNMHLAALCDRKVVSIWGGTHQYAGFGPLNQNVKNIVEVPAEDLSCRPCSVFGNKPCYRKDLACLERISPQMVIDKLSQ